jgi:hypothetical protein
MTTGLRRSWVKLALPILLILMIIASFIGICDSCDSGR